MTWGQLYRRSPRWLRIPVLFVAGVHGFVADWRDLRRCSRN